MTAVTATEFLGTQPGILYANKGYATAEIEQWLAQAERYCPYDVWLEHQQTGVKLRAAHMIFMDLVTKSQIANMAATANSGNAFTPATPAPSQRGRQADGHLQMSPHGQEFISLRNSLPTTGFGIFNPPGFSVPSTTAP